MLQGAEVAGAFRECGISHVIWLPDSVLGAWEKDLLAVPQWQLLRVCREGEAFALAAGLWLGGKQPVIVIQCTGLFEAGDALRNTIHELQAPLFLFIGLRSYTAYRQGRSLDTCPRFAEPILRAWQIPYRLLELDSEPAEIVAYYRQTQAAGQAAAILLGE